MSIRSCLAAALAIALAGHPALAEGPHAEPGFGSVDFRVSCAPKVQPRFDQAVARLHSFDGPEDAFRSIAADDPGCAMAWWGAAMSVRGNPLAGAPDADTIKSGRALVDKAVAAHSGDEREARFIDALGIYFRDYGPGGHPARSQAYEAAMSRLADRYPDDPEVQTFHGLAVLEAVDLNDKTYARQLKAGAVLEKVRAALPEHPGALHYLIHAYDYAPLAGRALDAARRYPGIASASMHAQHMPSHIYSMLGLWAESIAANESAAGHIHTGARHGAARLDAADPHGMDFIAYARLQLAQDRAVAGILAQARPSEERTLVAARYRLERGDWRAAADMPLARDGSALNEVTIRFVRALGAARAGRPVADGRREVEALRRLRTAVEAQEGAYWAGLVDVYARAADAWFARRDDRADEAITLMREAADLDDSREKHILLENKLLPMRELHGELLGELGRSDESLAAFEASLVGAPNRFRSYLGAARASRALNRADEARSWYGKLTKLAGEAAPGRPELTEARSFGAANSRP